MFTLSSLPTRAGQRPRTTPTNPHEQLDQNAPVPLQEALWAQMTLLPQTTSRPSGIAPHGSRALWTLKDNEPEKFMVGREFVHLHPQYDGSLHMVLPPEWADAAVSNGWAERHPLAGRFAPASTVMVYGPRDERELQIVLQMVSLAHGHATDAT